MFLPHAQRWRRRIFTIQHLRVLCFLNGKTCLNRARFPCKMRVSALKTQNIVRREFGWAVVQIDHAPTRHCEHLEVKNVCIQSWGMHMLCLTEEVQHFLVSIEKFCSHLHTYMQPNTLLYWEVLTLVVRTRFSMNESKLGCVLHLFLLHGKSSWQVWVCLDDSQGQRQFDDIGTDSRRT